MAAQVETVTVLFTDLVDSTALASRVGPERAEELRVEHFRLLRGAIAGADGFEVKNTGDGVMVVLPSAAAAVECAQAIQQRHELRNRHATERLLVRVGISMGDATRSDGDVFGPPVVVAARLCAKANPGQVLLSDVTRVMVGRRGEHTFRSVGDLELKGLPEPVAAWELLWASLAGATIPLPPRLQVLPLTAYVGREGIRDRLSQVRQLAIEGARQVVLIAGEPGIGKTRLATQLVSEAHAEGATVLFGHCDEELAASYQPWVQALRDLVEHAPIEVLAQHVGEHGGELCRLVPELARRLPNVPVPRVSDPAAERCLLFGAVVGLLQCAAAQGLLVVVLLDDLHWSDKPSLALLKHVVAHVVQARLLFLCTYRDSEIDANHPLSALLADLRREAGVEWVALQGLAQQEVESLIAAAAGHELTAKGRRLAAAVCRESDGNPFFVTEILRDLVESGGIVQGDGGQYVVTAEIGKLRIPRSVRDVVAQRIHRLGPDVVSVLSAAAVIGREFDLELLSVVSERCEDDLLAALESAVAGSVLRESPEALGRFVFAHALINHTLCEALSRTRRARLHLHIAQAIEDTARGDIDERLGELAYHWAAAGPAASSGKAIAYARRAGERALAQLAPDEALRWFAQALEQLGKARSVSEADRCDLMIFMGEAQWQIGEPAYRDTLLAAGEIASRIGDRERMARAAITNTRGWLSNCGDVDAERIAGLQAAIDVAPAGSPHRPLLLAQLAAEACVDWDFATRIRPLIDEALGLARRDADKHALAKVLELVTSALAMRPDLMVERLGLTHELLALADGLDDPFLGCMAAAMRFIATVEVADIDEARECARRAWLLSERTGQPRIRWVALFCATVMASVDGDLELADRHSRDGLAVGMALGFPDAAVFYSPQLNYVRYEQDRLDEEIIDANFELRNVAPGLSSIPARLSFYLTEHGRFDEAGDLLDEVLQAGFGSLNQDYLRLYALAHWGLTAVRLGDRDAIAEIYDLLYPYRTHLIYPVPIAFSSAHTILGRLAGALGRFDDAEQHFAAATTLHDRIGAPLFEARNLQYWAEMLLSRNADADEPRALAMLRRARDTARDLGGAVIVRHTTHLIDATELRRTGAA
ncbi:ATP-binding protein [Mycobacterium riyadhense]|uniref:ATP-binding protein n=1 Tax=Mycobacterium riyadhense TaxID=486698 RepID=UPI001950C59C|nr:adenylate/guanylate cyclase domain-containing protein [Mycobacterium riyadhense]